MLKQQEGVSLVESLIVLFLGTMILMIVISLYVTTISAGTKSMGYARLRSNLQSINSLIVNDIRRAGYGGEAYLVGRDRNKTVDSINTETENCIIYYYKHSSKSSENQMGFRLNKRKHEIQFGTDTDSSVENCYIQGRWEGISDSQFVKITMLNFTESIRKNEGDTIRSVEVNIKGELTSNSQIKYSLSNVVQVQNVESH